MILNLSKDVKLKLDKIMKLENNNVQVTYLDDHEYILDHIIGMIKLTVISNKVIYWLLPVYKKDYGDCKLYDIYLTKKNSIFEV